jgi:hypothetical protein
MSSSSGSSKDVALCNGMEVKHRELARIGLLTFYVRDHIPFANFHRKKGKGAGRCSLEFCSKVCIVQEVNRFTLIEDKLQVT